MLRVFCEACQTEHTVGKWHQEHGRPAYAFDTDKERAMHASAVKRLQNRRYQERKAEKLGKPPPPTRAVPTPEQRGEYREDRRAYEKAYHRRYYLTKRKPKIEAERES